MFSPSPSIFLWAGVKFRPYKSWFSCAVTILGMTILQQQKKWGKNKLKSYKIMNSPVLAFNTQKNPSYRRNWISQRVQIVAPITKISEKKKEKKKNNPVSPVTCHLSSDHHSIQFQLLWKPQDVRWWGWGKFDKVKKHNFLAKNYFFLFFLKN